MPQTFGCSMAEARRASRSTVERICSTVSRPARRILRPQDAGAACRWPGRPRRCLRRPSGGEFRNVQSSYAPSLPQVYRAIRQEHIKWRPYVQKILELKRLAVRIAAGGPSEPRHPLWERRMARDESVNVVAENERLMQRCRGNGPARGGPGRLRAFTDAAVDMPVYLAAFGGGGESDPCAANHATDTEAGDNSDRNPTAGRRCAGAHWNFQRARCRYAYREPARRSSVHSH